jgi:DNA-binding transcriptional ArsR family regulator
MSSFLLVPGAVSVRFAVDPVYNNLASLYMLDFAEEHQVDEWVKKAAAGLSDAQRRAQLVLVEILYSAYEPDEDWPSFPAYLDHLAQQDPILMRSRFLRHMFPDTGEECVRSDRLVDLQTFIAQIDHSEFDREFEHDLFAEAHALLCNPPAMRDAIVAHLAQMWRQVLSAEWERNAPYLQEIVDAFQRRANEYAGQTAYEAIRSVTGREAHGEWQDMLSSTETIVFVPSPHIGPYLMHFAYVPVVRMLFGAQFPQGEERSATGLDRADLLVQLRALADETRLRILDLLLDRGELCAQEIIAQLDLTRSSASRHLSQLSATGYLVERQGTGKAKCYALHPERFRETLSYLRCYARA